MGKRAALVGFVFALMFSYAAANVYLSLAAPGFRGWDALDQGEQLRVSYVSSRGPASLRVGDEIVEVLGDARGLSLARGPWRMKPGTRYTLVVVRDGQRLELHLQALPLPPALFLRSLVRNMILPAVFLCVGLWVFLLRPDDKQAFLLALVFGTLNLDLPLFSGLPWWLTAVLACGRILPILTSPLLFHLFLVFPEPSPLLRRLPRLEAYLYVPYLLTGFPYSLMSSFLLVTNPERAVDIVASAWGRVSLIVSLLYLTAGLLSLVVTYRHAGRGSRRKMRVVMAGSIAAGLPYILFTGGGLFLDLRRFLGPVSLEWLDVAVSSALLLAPFSFAYAILRHQVIPVSVILRRGARYMFVSGGSIGLEVLAVGLVLTVLLNTLFRYVKTSSGLLIGTISGVVSVAVWNLTAVLHRRVIAPAIDRRFFRQAYNAQQVLSEVGLALREMTDVREMTSLASAKIRDALQVEDVTVLLRQPESGDYRRGGDLPGAAADAPTLPADGIVVRHVRNASAPASVDLADPRSWAHALASSASAAEAEVLGRLRSALLVPVATKEELLGIISVGPRLGDVSFSREDSQLLMAVAWQMAFAVANAELVLRKADEERLRREVQIAAEVQRRLFPENAPAAGGVDLHGVCHPAEGVGGDYYDFLPLGEERIGVAVADVAGKGISAALLMSIVQASLRSQAASVNGRLTELAASMNRLLYRSTGSGSYASFFYAQFDGRTRRLTYVNAGHNPPMILRAGSEVEPRLAVGGPVIGIFESCEYDQGTVEMQSGDVLVAYTDGVTEAFNPAGEEYGESRLSQVVAEGAEVSAAELSEKVVRSVRSWSRDVPQYDDMTLVLMKVM